MFQNFNDNVMFASFMCVAISHTLPMYLTVSKPEHKINNGEKIGGAQSR